MYKADEKFKEAISHRDAGELGAARDILADLAMSPDATAAVFAVLGSIHWDLGDLSSAIRCFQDAAQIAPTAEVVSVGLFHTLFEAGRHEEAFDEMRRFLSIADSEEYQQLLADILKDDQE